MKYQSFIFITSILLTSISTQTTGKQNGKDWPLHSYNYSNSNHNATERDINKHSARYLRRSWQTFNDSELRPGPAPTGFILEFALGLVFPESVVGVIAPPIVIKNTIYYVDVLGTVFARDASTGGITNPSKHWTTTLVDNDFAASELPLSPDLYYSAPAATETHLWFHSSFNGRLHAIELEGGAEVDFDPLLAGIQPFPLVADQTLASSLGESVIVGLNKHGNVMKSFLGNQDKADRILFISEINVILNDALFQGQQTGIVEAIDITDPTNPFEFWRRATVDINPATGSPYNSGVSAGSGMAVDSKRGWLFGGTGQNTTSPYEGYPDPTLAPEGYVDRSDSIYAIDIKTGEFVWHNQFHSGDVFDLNSPVSTGPNMEGGPRDADVLSPPIAYSQKLKGHRVDFVAGGSKGGLFKAMNRSTGKTIWQRKISKATGIGGIQAGAAYDKNVVYVVGFEGIDDDFSDANFNLPDSLFANAFFATFAPSFWADVEDTQEDGKAETGMRIKVYALDASTGESKWQFDNGDDFVELNEGAALRHVSTTKDLVYVTTSSGKIVVIDKINGDILFEDQTVDLNQHFGIGLGKPHHASMNAGSIITNGKILVPYGSQNNPSGGMIAYAINHQPKARNDKHKIRSNRPVIIDVLRNDKDPDGDKLQITHIEGHAVNILDGEVDRFHFNNVTVEVFSRGDSSSDNSNHSHKNYLRVTYKGNKRRFKFNYTIEDMAPNQVVNNQQTDQLETTHTPRSSTAKVKLKVVGH
ncbi:MAG: hypothetical protein COA86_18430 [Kangiella sp.]|nr:MAG: hypothetical protein COA86_18430 [Kangiella sp.]